MQIGIYILMCGSDLKRARNGFVTLRRYTPRMKERIDMMRAVLSEAAQELIVSPATQAKMAEIIVLKEAEGASREELKAAALEAGKVPAA
jgi:hypothetical protein